MATAKERRAMAMLMQDPGFRAAWTNLRRTVFATDFADPDAACASINAAMEFVESAIASSPELTATAEAAEATEH